MDKTSNIQTRLGKNLRALRLKRGYSQEKLALKCGIDRTYLPEIEKGIRNISITVLEKLVIALDVEYNDLLQ